MHSRRAGWLIGALVLTVAFGQSAGWKVLYEARVPPPKAQVPARDQALMGRTNLRRLKGAGLACARPNFQLDGALQGSFTAPKREQRAYIYTTDCDDFTHLIVIEGGRIIVREVIYGQADLSTVTEAYPVRDMDRNGVDEIGVVRAAGENGFLVAWLTVWDASHLSATGRLRELHRSVVERYGCEPDDPRHTGHHTVYRLWIRVGPRPAVRADVYRTADCRDGTPLVLVGRQVPPEPFTP